MKNKYYVLILFISVLVISGCAKNPIDTNKLTNNQKPDTQTNTTVDNETENNTDSILSNINHDTATTSENIDISNWQIYKDNIFGFEFRHPDNWEVRTNKDIKNGGDVHYLMIDNKITVLSIKLNEIISDSTIDSMKKRNETIKNTVVDNYESYVATKNDGMRRYWYSYYFKTNEGSFKIYYRPVNINYEIDITDVSESEKEIVQKIMKTIEFK